MQVRIDTVTVSNGCAALSLTIDQSGRVVVSEGSTLAISEDLEVLDGTLELASTGGLTVGGELNKLAGNVGCGRTYAGVHYRSDNAVSYRLGEEFAIQWMKDLSETTTARASSTSGQATMPDRDRDSGGALVLE